MIDDIINSAKFDISKVNDLSILDDIRVKYLGKNSELNKLLKSLSSLPKDEIPKTGKLINQTKKQIQQILTDKKTILQDLALQDRVSSEKIDISIPARNVSIGNKHPITIILQKIQQIFEHQGFEIATGPEIEDDFHNFTALNIPKHHPARAMHDTFYFPDNYVLRTHTSPVQIRTLLNNKPPIRIIAPGRVYRCDSDITHSPMFHQVEGLIVEKNLNFAQLKGLLISFLKVFFDKDDLKVRFRPSYFPFTEPSAEVDIGCVICNSKGCRVCKGTGYLEVLGCGVVHTNVFEHVNIDNQKWLGLAFGMGIERLAMLSYGIDDLRLFFDNNWRFLKQF